MPSLYFRFPSSTFMFFGLFPNNIRFERIGTDDGLSQSNVICVLQDSRGLYVVWYTGWFK